MWLDVGRCRLTSSGTRGWHVVGPTVGGPSESVLEDGVEEDGDEQQGDDAVELGGDADGARAEREGDGGAGALQRSTTLKRHVVVSRRTARAHQDCTNHNTSTQAKFPGWGLERGLAPTQTLDRGQFFFKTQSAYGAYYIPSLHNHLKTSYLHYPSVTLED